LQPIWKNISNFEPLFTAIFTITLENKEIIVENFFLPTARSYLMLILTKTEKN